MDDRELGLLLNDLESDRVERKASLADPDKIRQTICAFANDLPDHHEPAVLFIGVQDDGQCAGLQVTDQLPRTLADMRSDGNITPIAGPLPQVLRIVDDKLEAHLAVARHPTVTPEVRQPDYPIVALRQLVSNAVLHRTYEGTNAPARIHWFSDRIEILSPGGPFGQVNRANFGQPGVTDYRNPHLAEAMKNLGYVQRFGVGIPITRKELEKNGNPPPEFQVEDTHILVSVRKH